MSKIFAFVLLMACLCLVAQAQLTFTSSWGGGKRSGIAGTVNCRNEESIAAIYKLIQTEAERLILCQKS